MLYQLFLESAKKYPDKSNYLSKHKFMVGLMLKEIARKQYRIETKSQAYLTYYHLVTDMSCNLHQKLGFVN